jgi:hypothetical protein
MMSSEGFALEGFVEGVTWRVPLDRDHMDGSHGGGPPRDSAGGYPGGGPVEGSHGGFLCGWPLEGGQWRCSLEGVPCWGPWGGPMKGSSM